jgi:hypothetical protein
LIRVNGGQRPTIHSPQRRPLRSAGLLRSASIWSGPTVLSPRDRSDRVRSAARTCEENPHGQIYFVAARDGQRCGRGSAPRARPRRRGIGWTGGDAALRAARSSGGSRGCTDATARGSAGGLILRHQSWAMQRRAPGPAARYRRTAALVRSGA